MEKQTPIIEGEERAAVPQPNIGPVFGKYGEAAHAGFQAVPDLLLKHQQDLRLSATDMVVLLNVLMHWWYPEQKPFPRATTIATRMGVTIRTVQRSIHAMQENGILFKEVTDAATGPTYLDPAPLVAKLREFALKDKDYLIRRKRNTA